MMSSAQPCACRRTRCLVCPIRRWCVTQRLAKREAAQSQEDAARPVGKKRTLDSSGEEEHLVSAQPAQWQNPPRATAKEGLTHARHVGIAESSEPPRRLPRPRSGARFAIPSPLRLHSARASNAALINALLPPEVSGCNHRIAQIPITGLTRKISKPAASSRIMEVALP